MINNSNPTLLTIINQHWDIIVISLKYMWNSYSRYTKIISLDFPSISPSGRITATDLVVTSAWSDDPCKERNACSRLCGI